jgi:hypothetical protein
MCLQQACSKLVNKLLECCYLIKLLQGCHSQLVDKLLNCTSINNLVASCQRAVDILSTSWEQAVRIHPVDKLLEQHCYLHTEPTWTCFASFQIVTYGMLFALVYQLFRSYGVIEDNNTKRLFPQAVSYLVNFICFMTIMVGRHNPIHYLKKKWE